MRCATNRRFFCHALALAQVLASPLAGGLPAPSPAGSADGISATLSQRDFLRDHPVLDKLLPDEWMEATRDRLTSVADKVHLQAALSYDALALGALQDAQDWGSASGDASLSLRWQPLQRGPSSSLSLAARLRNRHAFGTLSPTDLRQETGALWGYADGFTDAGVEVPEFYFEHLFFKERLLLRYGQMAPDDLLDDHRQRSGKRSFLNQAFASSPAVGFPGAGLGLAMRWTSPRGWDLTGTLSNLESSNVDERADWSFNTDALFAGLQLGTDFKGLGGAPARFQVLGWNGDGLVDENLSASRGISVTVEQAIGQHTRSVWRYAWSEGDLAPVAQMLVVGLTWEIDHLHRLGLGLATGEPSRPGQQRQTSVEVFYRHQFNANIVITPDLQLAVGDDLGSGQGWLALAGLRIGITF